MLKTTLKIEGMSCGMCEAHICDIIRKTVPEAKKVSASYKKGEAVFQTDKEAKLEGLKEEIAEMGYTMMSVESVHFEKKSLFGWFR